MLKFGMPLVPVSIAYGVIGFVDREALQRTSSLSAVGVYGIGMKRSAGKRGRLTEWKQFPLFGVGCRAWTATRMPALRSPRSRPRLGVKAGARVGASAP